MKSYRRKNVDAVQGRDILKEKRLAGKDGPRCIGPSGDGAGVVVRPANGGSDVTVGFDDFLLVDAAGNLTVLDAATFAARYEEAK